ncbi:MAG: hypothetical protein LBT05_08270 [Planctomycetaceae bacterium]|jgi:hypothetical protein|nr:hypothetical protein [Planctomycetaceae bacterium]
MIVRRAISAEKLSHRGIHSLVDMGILIKISTHANRILIATQDRLVIIRADLVVVQIPVLLVENQIQEPLNALKTLVVKNQTGLIVKILIPVRKQCRVLNLMAVHKNSF